MIAHLLFSIITKSLDFTETVDDSSVVHLLGGATELLGLAELMIRGCESTRGRSPLEESLRLE